MIPPGFVLVERSLNNEMVCGFRAIDLRADASKTFLSLCEGFIPCDPKKIKANTTQSFLTKVLEATMEIKALELPSKLEVAVKTLPKLLVAAKASGAKAAGKGAVIAKQEKKTVKS